jgi:hypothetical protein
MIRISFFVKRFPVLFHQYRGALYHRGHKYVCLAGGLLRYYRNIILFVVFSLCIVGSNIGLAGQRTIARNEKAQAFQPDCKSKDLVCIAWAEFRQTHPFPYQAIRGKRVKDDQLAIMIFEPAPVMSKGTLDQLIATAFGKDLVALRRLRWQLGVDGWLEDVVLDVKVSSKNSELLDDPILRDRVAFLHLALFGTTFGSSLEMDSDSKSPNDAGVPNLKITASELKQWLFEDSLKWRRFDSDADEGGWHQLASLQTSGAFISSDSSMVLLTFPVQLLRSAQANPDVLAPLEAPFHCFAVSTDAIIAGYESPNGYLAILGRRRTQSISRVPPLRFETFKLVASQSTDELSQSYERGAVFAGRLRSGEFRGLDWAPIYLSDVLIDTELGALLNTTDQLLKSWSEAGGVEYLYFTYNKPGSFPFAKPLSRVVSEATGSESVLYNWNTAGSSVLVTYGHGKILTTRQTGALPVTYGAEAQTSHSMETGKLLAQEEQAYGYFADRSDPNLERVVEYTMLFQFCRAIVAGSGLATEATHELPEHTMGEVTPAIKARRESTAVLVRATAQLLADFHSARIHPPASLSISLQSALQNIRTSHPELAHEQVASIIADRFSPDANLIRAEHRLHLETLRENLEKAIAAYNTDVHAYNEKIQSRKFTAFSLSLAHNDLDSRRTQINQMEKEYFAAQIRNDDPFSEAREALSRIALGLDPEDIRRQFVSSHLYDPSGAIKTPSIVVSWDSQDVRLIGGHNIAARPVRLEPSESVAEITLEHTATGTVLKYNPLRASSIESHAADLARAIEHGKLESVKDLKPMMEEAVPAPRPRMDALRITESSNTADALWSVKLGQRVYTDKAQFLDDFAAIAAKNECCVFIVHDENQVAFAVERNSNGTPPVLVHEIHDTPSMNEFLRGLSRRAGTSENKSIVFFETPESHVQALGLNAAADPRANLSEMAERLGQARVNKAEPRIDGVVARDLTGNTSTLKTVVKSADSRLRAFFSRIVLSEPETSWTTARVEALERNSAEHLVKQLDWKTGRDGIPAAVSLKFEPASADGLPPLDVSITAGFEKTDYAEGQAQLLATSQRDLRLAGARHASIAEYTMTLRNELQRMPALKLRRLLIVVRNGENKTVLSLRVKPAAAHETRQSG